MLNKIQHVIKTILDPNSTLKITNTETFTSIKVVDEPDLVLYLFPDSFGIKNPDYKVTPKDIVRTLKSTGTPAGIDKYFVYFDKDEHFNHEVNGEKVLPFELNHLVHEVFRVANKLTSDLERI